MAGETVGAESSAAFLEDLEDLKAQAMGLSAQVRTLMEGRPMLLDPLAGQHTTGPADTAARGELGEERGEERGEELGDERGEERGENDRKFPPFILLLDPLEYDDELRALIEWVEGVLVPGYLAEPSPEARWCPQWFEHPPAVARLHACWLAWQELTDPTGCGYTGPSVWHRDHLDPCVRELRAPQGPFRDCTKGEHQVSHRMPGLVPSAWRQEA